MAGRSVRSKIWMVADIGFLLLFAMSFAVQVNDPDPFRWMALYGAAAIACGLWLARRLPRWLPVVIAAAAILWGLTIVPRVLGKVPFLEMFAAWEMKDLGVEESREMYGLLLVAGWMLLLAWRSRRA